MVKVNMQEKKKDVSLPRERPFVPLPLYKYRRTMSSPMTLNADRRREDFEMKMTRSLPGDKLPSIEDIRKHSDIDHRLSFLILEAFSTSGIVDNENRRESMNRSLERIGSYSQQSEQRRKKDISKRKPKKVNSIETPSVIRSDISFQHEIQPIDEYPLYRVINEAVGDLAGLMSASVLKKTIKNQERYLDIPIYNAEAEVEEDYINASQEVDFNLGQASLAAKGFNLYTKAIPTQISNYLKTKCTLWRQENKKRLSIASSLSVNATSELKEESPHENKIVNEEDDTQVQYQPNHNAQLVKRLMEECTPKNIIYRNTRKGMFPYRINVKDFPDIHAADVNNSRHFLQTLIGRDKVMLNMRPSMIKINQYLVRRQSVEVDRRRKKLEENETKRLRKLQVQGKVHHNYDETENATDNIKLAEKPHITYNSLKPIFNENPFATAYKCMIKEFNRELVMKEKEIEDVASIGEVSFISSTSSYEDIDRNNTMDNLIQPPFSSDMSPRNSVHSTINKSCIKYMMPINQRLMQLENESKLSAIYKSSVSLMNI